MAQIDAALSVNPAAIGESRSDLLRVATFRPLTVWFRVIETDRRVVIMSVNLINPPGPRF
ncbi:MAG TPA: hypothetical protein VM165_22960 [Planctomycetaceae bacterium]|nr:hypothetical protein [Planctomycetaceae bacterium]